jgi:hypothetical protein
MKIFHTPGPWLIKDINNLNPDLRIGPDTRMGFLPICEVDWHRYSIETDKANARLIATSPELLEKLKLAIKCLNDIPNTKTKVGKSYDIISQLEATVRKVEGR